jgi:hypothetical protein
MKSRLNNRSSHEVILQHVLAKKGVPKRKEINLADFDDEPYQSSETPLETIIDSTFRSEEAPTP